MVLDTVLKKCVSPHCFEGSIPKEEGIGSLLALGDVEVCFEIRRTFLFVVSGGDGRGRDRGGVSVVSWDGESRGSGCSGGEGGCEGSGIGASW